MTGFSIGSDDGFSRRMATGRVGHDVMPPFAKQPFHMVSQPHNAGVTVVAGVPNEVQAGRVYFERKLPHP